MRGRGSNIQRELRVEPLHFHSIEKSKARRFRHLISMQPVQSPLQGVLGTSVRTEGPWVRSGLAGGITNPVLPASASGFPRRLLRGRDPQHSAATWLSNGELDTVLVECEIWLLFSDTESTLSSVLDKFLVRRESDASFFFF